jgi:hypothetical protein
MILGAASANIACSEGGMAVTISKAYRLNKDKPFASKILSLVESSMAAVSISVNLRKVDVGSKYYVRGGGEFKKIPAHKISGEQLTKWVNDYLKLCESRSCQYEKLMEEYPEITQITIP